MTKSYYKAPTSTAQPTIEDDFDFEDGFCRRLNKIQGIAELFCFVDAESRPNFSIESYSGISNILKDTGKELRSICYKMLEWEGDRENRLERTMKNFIDHLESQADDIEPERLRQMAANLRGVLGKGGGESCK